MTYKISWFREDDQINSTTVLNLIGTLFLQGLSFFTIPLLSRILKPEGYGLVSVYMTWASLFEMILGLQVGSTIPIAKIHFADEDQAKYQSSIFVLSNCSFIIFFFSLLIFHSQFQKIMQMNSWMVLACLLNAWGRFCIGFETGKNIYEFKAKKNFILSITVATLSTFFSICLIKIYPESVNYFGQILGTTIIYFSFGVLVAFFIWKKGKTGYNRVYWRFCIPLAFPVVLHSISGIILNQSDRVMIQKMLSNQHVGIYSMSATFCGVISSISSTVNKSWVPFFYKYMNEKRQDIIRKKTRNCIELLLIIVIGFIFLSPEVFRAFSASSYWGGVKLIPLFAVDYYFGYLYTFPVNYEFYKQKTKLVAIGTIGAATINIVLNYFFILVFKEIGAAVATTIAHCILFIFHQYCSKYLINDEYPYPTCFFVIPTIILSIAVAFFYLFSLSGIVRWCIGAFLGSWEIIQIKKRRTIF